MRVIPAIDIKDGRCVRLFKGKFDQVTEYAVDPAELAGRYQELGAGWIHCVDLDGARHGSPGNLQQIARIAGHLDAGIQVGGGIRDEAAIERLLGLGADRVVIGSVAAEKPGEALAWLREIGPERIVFALDVTIEDQDDAPMLVSRGWAETTRTSLWEALDRFGTGGLRHVLCTDIGRDGAMTGPAVDLYAECVRRYPEVAFQASGGVRHAADLTALAGTGAASAIVGKALLDGRISDEEIKPFLRNE
ncbi:MAG: 1-(5-phosphoribosyl)-5-[(5-phosphoribosylamino)methylideneamino]imidazole-4-carboxamide isomerase [Gammaproteobacteria bacterium]|jgi:phosphoribosylformimino-5-aminoimidazole carboxamide ribotide isomerase